jgi:hypothetical protein
MIFRCRHLLLTSVLSLVLSLVSSGAAQGFNFGVGLGFLRQDTEGNLVVSVPLNFPVTSFGKVGLELRTTADFVVSSRPDVSFLLSPFSLTHCAPLISHPLPCTAARVFACLLKTLLPVHGKAPGVLQVAWWVRRCHWRVSWCLTAKLLGLLRLQARYLVLGVVLGLRCINVR